MALFNESLVGRFNLLIARLHGRKGGPPAPQISPEITHAIILENDRFENRYLALHSSGWVSAFEAAGGAGTFTELSFGNPAGSGILIVLEGIYFNTANTVRLEIVSGSLGGAILGNNRDGRAGVTVKIAPTVGVGNVAVVDPIGQSQAPRVGAFASFLPITAAWGPGQQLHVVSAATNVSLDITIFYSLRALESSET